MREFTSTEDLEDFLSTPDERTNTALSKQRGDILVLGAGGKMGPTLCRVLKRASGQTIHAVSRYSDGSVRSRLEDAGISTIKADLLEPESYERLPEAPTVFFLAGMKFGAGAHEPRTWAMNVYMPALVARRFSDSRIVALSTGNVYPFVPVDGGGATEKTPTGPVGEYAQSCLGRERIFQFFSGENGTPVTLIRLNYANEPRYGIIVDITRKILAGEPVDLTMGHVNLIWQGDANNLIARSQALASSPAAVLNVTGPATVRVRDLAERIAGLVGREARFIGAESPTALLSDAGACFASLGRPTVSLEEMTEAIVRWVASGKPVLGKPTKFQVRDGRF